MVFISYEKFSSKDIWSSYAYLKQTLYPANSETIAKVRSGVISLNSSEFSDFLALHLQTHFLKSFETETLVDEDQVIDLCLARLIGGLGLPRSRAVLAVIILKLKLVESSPEDTVTSSTLTQIWLNLAAQVCLAGAFLGLPTPEIDEVFNRYLRPCQSTLTSQSLLIRLQDYAPATCLGYVTTDAFALFHQNLLLEGEPDLRNCYEKAKTLARRF